MMEIKRKKGQMLLILPYDRTYYYKGFFKQSLSYAPLTLITLAALVPVELNFEIDIIDEGVQQFDLDKKQYDIVGITCVASSAPRVYELAKKLKTKGSFIIMGGAHTTLNPLEAVQYADVVVSGFAEKIWPQILIDFSKGKPLDKIYYSTKEKVLSTTIPCRDKLPHGKYLKIPTVIASRGCVNNCCFCSIHKIWNNSSCSRPVDEVIQEIKQLKNSRVIMLDPNIIADKEYAMKLFELLIPLKKHWAGLATIDFAEDKELFDLAVRSGCKGILAGFESIYQESLIECGKANQTITKYKQYVQKFHKNGISILGCFVLGFDNDDESVFQKTVEFVDKIEIDIPRFAVLTPFPGTSLYCKYKEENRILTDDLTYYDTEHVVFRPNKMSPEKLQEGLYDVWKKTYSVKRILKRTRKFPQNRLLGFMVNTGFRYYARQLSNKETPYFLN